MASYFKEFKQTRRIYYVGEEGYEVIYYPNGEISKPARMGKFANEQLRVYEWFERNLSKTVQTEAEFRNLRHKFSELGYDSYQLQRQLFLENCKPQDIKAFILGLERQHWLLRKG